MVLQVVRGGQYRGGRERLALSHCHDHKRDTSRDRDSLRGACQRLELISFPPAFCHVREISLTARIIFTATMP